jgi:hypothetical protein
MKTWLIQTLLGVAWLAASSSEAAEKLTTHTLRLSQGESSPPATIEVMAWLTGGWSGTGLGGDVEEMWSPPRAGRMLGMYRIIKDDRVLFYELLVLREVDNSLELRIKHFDAELRGWEDREDSVMFPFVAQRDGRIYFDGVTFEPHDDAVTLYLAIHNKGGSVHEEVFRYRRAM